MLLLIVQTGTVPGVEVSIGMSRLIGPQTYTKIQLDRPRSVPTRATTLSHIQEWEVVVQFL